MTPRAGERDGEAEGIGETGPETEGPGAPDGTVLRGRVVRIETNATVVHADDREIPCLLRGVDREGHGSDEPRLPVVGDVVRIRRSDDVWVVVEIEPRRSKLSRAAAGDARREQVVCANVDRLVCVIACRRPEPNWFLVDRLLVAAGTGGLEAAIVCNKMDTCPEDRREELDVELPVYRGLGYPVVRSSARTGRGVDDVRGLLRDRVSVLAGPSGAGKSSLVNAVQPGLELKTGDLQSSGEGRHTTTGVSLLRLEDGGYVADTPGVRALALWDVHSSTLAHHFPEIRDRMGSCRFNDCSHLVEPGCAVRAAVDAGEIHERRFRSYRRMMETLADGEGW